MSTAEPKSVAAVKDDPKPVAAEAISDFVGDMQAILTGAVQSLKLGDRVGALRKLLPLIKQLDLPKLLSAGVSFVELLSHFGLLSLSGEQASEIVLNLLSDRDTPEGLEVQQLARTYSTQASREAAGEQVQAMDVKTAELYTQAIDVATAVEATKSLVNLVAMIRDNADASEIAKFSEASK